MVGVDFLGYGVRAHGLAGLWAGWVGCGWVLFVGVPMVSYPGGFGGDSGAVGAERGDRESDDGVRMDPRECAGSVGCPVVSGGRGEGGDRENCVCKLLGIDWENWISIGGLWHHFTCPRMCLVVLYNHIIMFYI